MVGELTEIIMNLKERIEVMQAHLDKKPIQERCLSCAGNQIIWRDVTNPDFECFDWQNKDYRIKPKGE